MLNNISLPIITSDVVYDSVDLVLPDAVIITVTDDEQSRIVNATNMRMLSLYSPERGRID